MSLNDLLFTFLRMQGHSGSLQEMWEVSDLGQMTNEGLWRFLGNLGYYGSINDRLYWYLLNAVSPPPLNNK